MIHDLYCNIRVDAGNTISSDKIVSKNIQMLIHLKIYHTLLIVPNNVDLIYYELNDKFDPIV